MIEIGKLRHRALIEQPNPTPDGGGGGDQAWAMVATVWAAVEPVSGREVRVAEKLNAEITHKVTIRYRDDVDASMRFDFGGRKLRIRAVINPLERNIWLECLCEEEFAA